MKYIRVVLTERRGLQFLNHVDVLTEIFQVEIHQACIIFLVFLSKESELVVLVESCCSSKGINCNKSASCPVAMSKNELYSIKHYTSYTLPNIFFANSKTSNFYSRIVITLLAEWNFSVDTITYALLSFIQTNDIIQQTIISNDVAIDRIDKEVGNGKVFRLIILRFIQ